MDFGMVAIGFAVFYFLFAPKSFGRHLAEIEQAYRRATVDSGEKR